MIPEAQKPNLTIWLFSFKKNERQRENRQKAFIYMFTSQMLTMTRGGLGLKLGTRTQSSSPRWVVGTQGLDLWLCARMHIVSKKLEVRALLAIKPRYFGTCEHLDQRPHHRPVACPCRAYFAEKLYAHVGSSSDDPHLHVFSSRESLSKYISSAGPDSVLGNRPRS